MENLIPKLKKKDEVTILFLCSGNIVRSPTAEMLLELELNKRYKTTRVKAISGATTYQNARIMDITKDFLIKEGVSPERVLQFFPRNIKKYPELVKEADIIIGMTGTHIRLTPKQYRNKAFILSEVAIGEKHNIPDPWGDDLESYLEVFAIVKEYILKLVDNLEKWKLVP